MSESKLDGEGGVDKGKYGRESDKEGVLGIQGCSEDVIDSLNGLFHWQMEDYELPYGCNMLQVDKEPDENECLPTYGEYTEGDAPVNETPAHRFDMTKRRNQSGTKSS